MRQGGNWLRVCYSVHVAACSRIGFAIVRSASRIWPQRIATLSAGAYARTPRSSWPASPTLCELVASSETVGLLQGGAGSRDRFPDRRGMISECVPRWHHARNVTTTRSCSAASCGSTRVRAPQRHRAARVLHRHGLPQWSGFPSTVAVRWVPDRSSDAVAALSLSSRADGDKSGTRTSAAKLRQCKLSRLNWWRAQDD